MGWKLRCTQASQSYLTITMVYKTVTHSYSLGALTLMEAKASQAVSQRPSLITFRVNVVVLDQMHMNPMIKTMKTM